MENTNNQNTPRGIFPGWWAFIGGLLAVIFHGAISSIGGYILGAMVLDGDIGSTIPGYCSSIISLCSVLFAAPFGAFLQKRGHRWGLLMGEIAAIIGFAVLAFGPSNSALTIAMYFLLGFSVVAACKVGGPSLVNCWFQKRKELPMTLVIAAGSLGSIFSGIVASIVEKNGWRGGWVFMLGLTVVSAVCVILLVRDKVHGIGEVRDGKAWRLSHGIDLDDADVKKAVKGEAGESSEGRWGMLKNPRFMLFSLACLFRMGAYAGSMGYVTLIIVSKGFTKEQAALAVGSVALASVVGRLSAPVWTKVLKLSGINVNRISNILMAIGALIIFGSSNLSLLSFAAMLIGFSYGMGYVSQTLTLSELFPEYDFTTVFGAFTTVVNVAFIFPTAVGVIGAALGGYGEIYLAFAIVNIIFAVLFGFCKNKKSSDQTA